jgi:hypothetical protein
MLARLSQALARARAMPLAAQHSRLRFGRPKSLLTGLGWTIFGPILALGLVTHGISAANDSRAAQTVYVACLGLSAVPPSHRTGQPFCSVTIVAT